MNDPIAHACGTFDTARTQPIRVCASALPLSQRMPGMSNGTSLSPVPCSSGRTLPSSGAKVDRIDGATER